MFVGKFYSKSMSERKTNGVLFVRTSFDFKFARSLCCWIWDKIWPKNQR